MTPIGALNNRVQSELSNALTDVGKKETPLHPFAGFRHQNWSENATGRVSF